MNMLMVTSLYSGLCESVETGCWRPSGVPVIYKLVETLGQEKHSVTWVILGTETSPAAGLDGTTKMALDGFDADLHIIPCRGGRVRQFTSFIAQENILAFGDDIL